jgi:hypothetical protein
VPGLQGGGVVSDDAGTSVLHKHPKTREFVQIENSTVRDPRLSFKATGLLAHLLSLPQGSKLGSVELAKSRPDGRVAIQTAYRELREHGYVTQEKVRADGGKWKTVTHVYEVPPNAENLPSEPSAGFPASENLPLSLRDKDGEIKNGSEVVTTCPVCCESFTAGRDFELHFTDCGDPDLIPASSVPAPRPEAP